MNRIPKNVQSELDDESFLAQFENRTLPPELFSHMGHLRIAWLYLTRHDTDNAIEKICSGIKAYAESHGANRKFHVTITVSLVRIMARRIDALEQKSWSSFLTHNIDLQKDAISVLRNHYSQELLFSEEARTTLAVPDIKQI